eukprot:1409020-Rhodomonas_salina.4
MAASEAPSASAAAADSESWPAVVWFCSHAYAFQAQKPAVASTESPPRHTAPGSHGLQSVDALSTCVTNSSG